MVEIASAASPFASPAETPLANRRLGHSNDFIVISSFCYGTHTLAFGITASSSADTSYTYLAQGIDREHR